MVSNAYPVGVSDDGTLSVESKKYGRQVNGS